MKNVLFLAIVCCIIGAVDGQTLLTGNKAKQLQRPANTLAMHSCDR